MSHQTPPSLWKTAPPSAPRCTTAAPPSPLPAPGLAPPRCTSPPSTPLWKTAALDTQVSGRGPDLDTLMSGPALAVEDIILATQVSNAAPDPGLLVDHGAADGGEPPPVANILTLKTPNSIVGYPVTTD